MWESGWFAEQKHKYQDLFEQGGNHALIVAGLEVDPKHPENVNVILTDPGSGDLRITYKWSKFHNAWDDSKCTMISTTQPAPYQYNAETCQMEPSGFATDFYPSQIHLPVAIHNVFPPLSDEYYSLYRNYEPTYSESNCLSIGNNLFATNNPYEDYIKQENSKNESSNEYLGEYEDEEINTNLELTNNNMNENTYLSEDTYSNDIPTEESNDHNSEELFDC